ncbi:hypothetical protein [Serratia entomophila]|uniref:hypothetical protein n=1 Tax=Serratia entomophila TaxID=42906 RepID=UPI002179EE5C|nr:hypothetical protein [Serratia entomophila]CAI0703146.1 Uncharacterised protein [Serratia entomophila]CAI0703563.1 Uncharacterised protein [Serratia entomophila]CAI0704190.1 Uncharacterised protein [Serratia entomophila]CAI0875638.1 Uncharacterised protein [Serratia entomophila]CAI1531388.1 Uncharacterised protein [Serratia entomophila]
MFLLGKLFGGRNSEKVRAIKMLPEAYAEMVGGSGRCRLKHLRPEIGFFELHFTSDSGEKHICQMTACVTGLDVVFAANNRSVLISPPFSPAKLRPVFDIALVGCTMTQS